MTGIPQIDQATNGFLTTLPKHGVEQVTSEERKEQKTNFLLIRKFILKKLESMPDCDTKKCINENLNVATDAIDTMARHGAKFISLNDFAGKDTEEQATNFYVKLSPILKDPTTFKDFTLALAAVGSSYKNTKDDLTFKDSVPKVFQIQKERQIEKK